MIYESVISPNHGGLTDERAGLTVHSLHLSPNWKTVLVHRIEDWNTQPTTSQLSCSHMASHGEHAAGTCTRT